MEKRKKSGAILFWLALVIYGISLFLPYKIVKFYNQSALGSEPDIYDSGFKLSSPLFALVPIIGLVVFQFLRYSGFRRWAGLILTVSLIFPLLPFIFITIEFCWDCSSNEGVGFYLYVCSCILFLIAAIQCFRVPIERNKNTSDLLDNF